MSSSAMTNTSTQSIIALPCNVMPLPSVVVMTVPRSPATLSRLLRAGSSQDKPGFPGCGKARLPSLSDSCPACFRGRQGSQPFCRGGWWWGGEHGPPTRGSSFFHPSFLLILAFFLFLSFSFSYFLSPSVSLFPPHPLFPFLTSMVAHRCAWCLQACLSTVSLLS